MANEGQVFQGATTGAAGGAAGGVYGALAGGALGALGGLFGGHGSNPAGAAEAQAEAYYSGIAPPTLEAQDLSLQNYTSAGQLNPLLQQAILQQNSNFANISTSPQLQAAQNQALANLQAKYSQGYTPDEMAQIKQIQQQAAQQAGQGEQNALQDAARRGMLNSGSTLAAQLSAGQAGAQMQSQQGMQLAGQIAQAKQQAAQQAGQLAGQMQQTSFGQQAQQASAQDLINQFNTQSKVGVQNYNVNAQNQAQAQNLNNAQTLSNANTNLTNTQQQYNKQLMQQQYQNQMDLAKAKSGIVMNGLDAQLKGNAANQSQFGNLITGLGTLGSALGSAYAKNGNSTPKVDQATADAITNAKPIATTSDNTNNYANLNRIG